MFKTYLLFRRVLGWLFLAILAALIGEFAIEIGREHGLYDHPTAKLGAVMSVMAALRDAPWFWPLICGMGGLLAGMYIDAFMRRYMAGRKSHKSEAETGSDFAKGLNTAQDNQLYVADPEAEALDKPAYNQLVAFCIDHLLPTCDAQVKMQEAIIRQLCNNETMASLAIEGLHNDWKYETRGFWENYINLSSGLGDSPGPSIKFEGMIECVHELEKGFYKNFCDQGIKTAESAGLNLQTVFGEWQGWLFKHNKMTNEYPKLSRDIRFGKLHRLKPSRWGAYS